MSEPESFLARWNRRKQEAKREEECAEAPRAAPEVADDKDAAREGAQEGGEAGRTARPVESGAEPEKKDAPFDPASLPSIESITAETDIRAFLAPGVPAELSRAALRRAWSADPVIRDFVGIAENQWDFTAPNEILGFGPLESGEEIARLVAKVFGDAPAQDGPAPDDQNVSAPNTGTKVADVSAAAPAVPDHVDAPDNIVQRNENNTAVQSEEQTGDDLESGPRRSHGRALPQ